MDLPESRNKKKNRKQTRASLVVLSSAFFFFFVKVKSAAAIAPLVLWGLAGAGAWAANHFFGNVVENAFFTGVNMLLYALLNFIGLFLTPILKLFYIAVAPAAVSATLNMSSIYTLWGMIRDFFNLFFILTLLFIAFCTIFQIQAYNYKKWLLNLVLMALLTNFSFPVTRFIIDATNVPMYFFMESMFSEGADKAPEGIIEESLGASNIKRVLVPEWKDVEKKLTTVDLTIKLLGSIIFLFLLFSALLVLALLLFIRLIVLAILVIFSPVGFAGSAIPGIQKYASEWWNTLFKYALFGPSAMLMLLIAVLFMREFNGITETYGAKASSGVVANKEQDEYLSSFVSLTIPVILIWMSIGVGQKMGVAGGSAIAGAAYKFAKSTGKTMSGYNAGKRRFDAYKSERKKRADAKFAASNIGTRFAGVANRASDQFSSAASLTRVGRNMAKDRLETSQQELVKEEAKRSRINDRMSDSELRIVKERAAKRNNQAEFAAAVQEMATRENMAGEITKRDMDAVKTYFTDSGGVTNAVVADTQKAVAAKNAAVAYDNNVEKMTDAFKNGKIKMEDQTANSLTANLLQAALETNKVDQKILDELNKDGEKGKKIKENFGTAMNQFESGYAKRFIGKSEEEAKALEKQRVNAHKAYFSRFGKFYEDSNGQVINQKVQNKVFEKADEITLAGIAKDEEKLAAVMPMMLRNAGASRTVSSLAKLAEDGNKIRKATQAIVDLSNNPAQGPGQDIEDLNYAAQAAHKSMGRDHRFGWVARVNEPNARGGNNGNATNRNRGGGAPPLRNIRNPEDYIA